MAGDMSTYLGNKVIRWLDGNAFPSAPSGLWVALYNGGSEVTSTVRVAGRVDASGNFTAPGAGTTNTMSNASDIDFGTAAGSTAVDEVRIYDASTSGNLLFSKALSASITAGEAVKFATGDMSFTCP